MDILRVISPIYSENCYVLCPDSRVAVVVDPGAGTATRIEEVLRQLGASLGAILFTHGHADHIWDAAQVAALNPQAPVYVAAPDYFWFENPGPAVQLGNSDYMESHAGTWRPLKVQILPPECGTGGGAQLVPGLNIRALPAPGHSPGCTLYFFAGEVNDHGQELGFIPGQINEFCFSGDVVFCGSIGRTDLPYSDAKVMAESLRTIMQVVNPATVLLPGHGPATTWKEELESNPFLPKPEKVTE